MSKDISNKALATVIASSSVGTLIEWYDFYIFGSLAKEISTQFFPSDNPTAAFLSTLATFAAGFIVRPFGALFFGRLHMSRDTRPWMALTPLQCPDRFSASTVMQIEPGLVPASSPWR